MGCDTLDIMVMSGPDDGKLVSLRRAQGHGHVSTDGTWSLFFGRRDDCDVVIPFDTQVSRKHACVRIAPDGRLWLDDEGSLNGTYLEQDRVTAPVPVLRGQLFRLGRTWFRIQVGLGEGL